MEYSSWSPWWQFVPVGNHPSENLFPPLPSNSCFFLPLSSWATMSRLSSSLMVTLCQLFPFRILFLMGKKTKKQAIPVNLNGLSQRLFLLQKETSTCPPKSSHLHGANWKWMWRWNILYCNSNINHPTQICLRLWINMNTGNMYCSWCGSQTVYAQSEEPDASLCSQWRGDHSYLSLAFLCVLRYNMQDICVHLKPAVNQRPEADEGGM